MLNILRMSDIQSTSTIDFDADEFFRKDDESESIKLPPWADPDKKIEEYRRRRQNHIVKRDNYKQRFIEYKTHIRKMRVGSKSRPPSRTLPEFLIKV